MKFKRVYIEITNACNMTCNFCPESSRDIRFMTVEEFEAILIQIKEYTSYIYLHVKGEPFFHPKLAEILCLCEKYKIKVNITTNGVLIKQIEDTLLKSNAVRQINFSLHSFEENNDFKQIEYLDNIFNFVRQSKNIFISLRLWNIDSNLDNSLTLSKISSFFKLEKISEEFIRGKGLKLAEKVYLNFEEVFEWPSLNMPVINSKGHCYGLNSHMGILSNGTVVPCCLDQDGIIELGNIFETSLNNILNSNRSRNIIQGFKSNNIVEELCQKCSFRKRFS